MLMPRNFDALIRNTPEPFHAVLTFLLAWFQRNEVIELRLMEPYQRGHELRLHGYFNWYPQLIQAALRMGSGVDITFGVNPVRHGLIHAAFNEIRWTNTSWPARGNDISRRATLVVPFRPTHEKLHPAAMDCAIHCRDFLTTQGWPDPVVADDGNGTLLLYAVDLPNTEESTLLVRGLLATLSLRFSTTEARVDAGVFQPDLFVRLFGTTDAVFGRPSAILDLSVPVATVDTNLLHTLLMADGGNAPVFPVPDKGDGNTVSRFVIGQCSPALDTWTPTSVLYDAYHSYCHKRNLEPLPIAHFARQLVAEFGLEPDRRKINGKVTRGFWGITLRADSMTG